MSESPLDDSVEGVALIGMSARFPGANDVAQFWRNLCDGVESISFLSDDELKSAGVGQRALEMSNYVKAAPLLDQPDRFDAAFFGCAPREAEVMDPQQRLFLETAWEALENAGYNPEECQGTVGVFAGASFAHYAFNLYSNPDVMSSMDSLQLILGNAESHLATRTSYKLNLKGPSVFVQSACSTSLVAIHLAIQSLLNHECEAALAGGVSLTIPKKTGYFYDTGGVLSPDGHCRPFDAHGKGTVIGNGVGVVVLKRLHDAVASGDTIHAVIRGSAINNDGAGKVGYTAPSVQGQAAVIVEAQALGGVSAESFGYIECHGTATELGDPIEIEALTKAFRLGTDKKRFCAIGSVKSNFGHLLAAAGVAGVIKTVLALKHKKIPPTLHFESPNSRIDFENSPFFVNTRLREWQPHEHHPRRAGVSSFGIGGTNAHVVLEEAPPEADSDAQRSCQTLVLSAKTQSALALARTNLGHFLQAHPKVNLTDAAYTLAIGRRVFPWRAACVCATPEEAVAVLTDGSAGGQEIDRSPLVMMFPGQGAQYANLGASLYRHNRRFREEMDRCFVVARKTLSLDLKAALFCDSREQLDRTSITQPALFAVEYSLARVYFACGVTPEAMIGHSVGEYVAACLAGVMSFETALETVGIRGRLMEATPEGRMVAVSCGETEARRYLGEGVWLAAINGPVQSVLTGTREGIERVCRRLQMEGVPHRTLPTRRAFHSGLMTEAAGKLVDHLRNVDLKRPQLRYISNTSGSWMTDEQATRPEYWGEQLLGAVRFWDGLQEVSTGGGKILLEVGPGEVLSGLSRGLDGRSLETISAIGREEARDQEHVALERSLARLWVNGWDLDWSKHFEGERRRKVALPTYPFERQRYWIDGHDPATNPLLSVHEAAKSPERRDITDWLYVPSWRRSMAPGRTVGASSRWLIFGDSAGLGEEMARNLRSEDKQVVLVPPEKWQRTERVPDYERIVGESAPGVIVHLGGTTLRRPDAPMGQLKEFYSLLYIGQALGRRGGGAAVKITVVTSGMQAVIGGDLVCPEKATVLGPAKVLAQEYRNVSSKCVDLHCQELSHGGSAKLIDYLIAEAEDVANVPGAEIAYRGNYRWVKDYVPIRQEKTHDPSQAIEAGAVVIITGGTGGIGRTLAEHLAVERKAEVILTARRGIDISAPEIEPEERARRQAWLRRMHESNAHVRIIQADASQAEDMRRVVETVKREFGKIDVAIHCAGEPGSGMIQRKTRESVERVMGAKLHGARVLEEVLEGEDTFIILMSSVAALRGGVGQVDYSGANAFLDALAHHRAEEGRGRTLSINWSGWAVEGMAARAIASRRGLERNAVDGPRLHPLVHRIQSDGEGRRVYSAMLSAARDWVLGEHRISGHATLSGTAYLEMVRAAFEDFTKASAIELRGVSILAPLMFDDFAEREVSIILERDSGTFRFRVVSNAEAGEGSRQEHAVGEAQVLSSDSVPDRDPCVVSRRCEVSVPPPVSAPGQMLSFGKRWLSTLKEVRTGSNEAIARIELSQAFLSDLDEFRLHPAVLDVALGFARQVLGDGGSYLPVFYKRIAIRGPLPQVVYSHARRTGGKGGQTTLDQYDVTIMDEHGAVLVEVEEYTLKRILDAESRLSAARNEYLAGGGILPEEAVEVFQRALAVRGFAQIVICPTDLDQLMEIRSREEARFLDGAAENGSIRPRHARRSQATAFVEPGDEVERIIAGIWEELLGITHVGTRDDFFTSGGDSLLAIRVTARLKERFSVELAPTVLFDHSTVSQLSKLVIQALAEQLEREAAGVVQRGAA